MEVILRTFIAAGNCNALQLQNEHVIWRNLDLKGGTENIWHLIEYIMVGYNEANTQLSPSKIFRWSERSVLFTAWMFSWNHKSRMLCDVSISKHQAPNLSQVQAYALSKCLAWWKEVSVVPYTALELSWATVLRWYPEVFNKGNAMVISTSSRKRQHAFVEASGATVVAICRRGAEIINTFWFSKISAFFFEIYCFLRKTRLLSNLARTPCSVYVMARRCRASGSVFYLSPCHVPCLSVDIIAAFLKYHRISILPHVCTGHCRSNAPHSLRVTYLSVAP